MTSVTVAQGKLKGGEDKTPNGYCYYEFLEIPYAKPPVGNLRFKVIYIILRSISFCFTYFLCK